MIIKKALIALCVSTPLVIGVIVYVAAMPTNFEQDIKAGNAQLSNDSVAYIQANKLKDNEKLEGRVDNIHVQVNQTISQQISSKQENVAPHPQKNNLSDTSHKGAATDNSRGNLSHKNKDESNNSKPTDTAKRKKDNENN